MFLMLAYRISFSSNLERGHGVLLDLGISRVVGVRSVIAEEDDRWLAAPQANGSLAIGKGAAGCLLAHLDAWKAIALSRDDGSYSLVLESDALPTRFGFRHFHDVLHTARALEANVIQIGTNRSNSRGPGRGTPFGDLFRSLEQVVEVQCLDFMYPRFHQTFRSGTHAYLIRKEYASWLAQWTPDFLVPIDHWLQSLSRDARHKIFRVRQDLWTTTGRSSEIEMLGR